MCRDTVCSVGLIPRRLPFVSSNTAIRYFRHALSLDERRAKFKANLYNRPTEDESKLGVQPGEMPAPAPAPTLVLAGKDATLTARTMEMWAKYMTMAGADLKELNIPGTGGKDSGKGKKRKSSSEDDDADAQDALYDQQYFSEPAQPKKETDVLEVWFSGCHCGMSPSFPLPHPQR